MKEQQVLDGMIFKTLAGSRVYGTHTEESDYDYRGITCLADKELYFGTGRLRFDQKNNWDDGSDQVIYDVRKALALMLDNSPAMLEMLFTPEQFWLHNSDAWEKICNHRYFMISKRLRHTFGGYAFAQLKRIRGHRNYLLNPPKKKPERSDFGLQEKRAVTNDEVNNFLWLIQKLIKDSIEYVHLSDATREELRHTNYIGVVQSKNLGNTDEEKHVISQLTSAPDGFIDSCMREKQLLHAVRDYEAYERWSNDRNARRKELEAKHGYDCKHAMHLVRLLRMGIEALEWGALFVYRRDQKELAEIRNGAWSFELVENYAKECDEKLNELYKTSKLPDKPDYDAIERLCIDVVESSLSR